MRKAKSTARKEASIVGTRAASAPLWVVVVVVVWWWNEASLGISLSRFVVVRAQKCGDFTRAKN